MIALGIDTSSPSGSAGLHGPDGPVSAELSVAAGLTHSERLLIGIRALLEAAGVRLDQLGLIAVAAGPGSFTGLRIGMATAKGLALACGCPVTGFSTLETIATACAPWSGPAPGRVVCVLLDAGRGEVYRGIYRAGAAGMRPIVAEAALPPAEAVAPLDEPSIVVGDGLAAYAETLAPLLPAGSLPVPASPPIGLALARRAGEAARVLGLDRLPPLTPNYLRVSDAERSRRD